MRSPSRLPFWRSWRLLLAAAAGIALAVVLFRSTRWPWQGEGTETSCDTAGTTVETFGAGRAEGPEAASSAGRSLRFVSYNVHGRAALKSEHHAEEVARTVSALAPDVAGLQEIHRGTLQSRGVDQASAIAIGAGLSGLFGPSLEMAGGGLYGNLLLTRGEILAARVHRLPGSGEPRSVLAVRLRLAGRELTALVTHLSAWGPFRSRERRQQVACLAEIAGRATGLVVVLGDLNVGPGSPELAAFAAAGLRRCDGGVEPTYTVGRRRIDYILCSPGLEASSARVERIGPSDHWPLVVELAWAEPVTRGEGRRNAMATEDG